MSEEPVTWWDDRVLDRERWGSLVEPSLERLHGAWERDRVPQSLLLVGPQGLGRELAAVETAAMLVCAGAVPPWSTDPCAERVRTGVHPDVQAVLPTGAKQIIAIRQVREVVDSAPSRPYEGRRRVWIFDGVEAGHLGAEAANAFLKILEEPPEHVVFILLADNSSAVLPTIISRCQQLVLPGAVAVARSLAESTDLPELIRSSLASEDFSAAVKSVRAAIESAKDGELRDVLRLPYALPEELPPFATVAAVAIEMAAGAEDGGGGEEMARLAAELLSLERRTRALNLNPRGQLISCLMRWYRDRTEDV